MGVSDRCNKEFDKGWNKGLCLIGCNKALSTPVFFLYDKALWRMDTVKIPLIYDVTISSMVSNSTQ